MIDFIGKSIRVGFAYKNNHFYITNKLTTLSSYCIRQDSRTTCRKLLWMQNNLISIRPR